MVLREMSWILGIGLVTGVPAALVLAKLTESQLYGVKPHDAVVVAVAVLALAVTAVAAAYLPARRASQGQSAERAAVRVRLDRRPGYSRTTGMPAPARADSTSAGFRRVASYSTVSASIDGRERHFVNSVERVGVGDAREQDVVERLLQLEPDLNLRHKAPG